MKIFKGSLLLLIIPLLFVSLGCKKEKKDEQPKVPGVVSGTVTNIFGQPLPGTKVLLKGLDSMKVITNQKGKYIFIMLPWMNYSLMFSLKNYISQSKNFTVSSYDTTRIDAVLQPGTPYTRLLDSILLLPYTGGVRSIRIESNTGWTITNPTGWISSDPTIGQGNETILATCQENPNMAYRSCILTVNDGNHDHSVVIHQGYQILLSGASYTLGNETTGERDSITLTFNQPVTVKELTNGQISCNQETHMRYLGDSSSIRFNYNCGRLGGEFQIGYTVMDRFTNALTGTAKVRFYTNKLNLPGRITSFFISDDNSVCWVAMQYPGRLIEVSMNSHAVIRTINLQYNPYRICMNPWDHKIYLIATDAMNNRYDSNIYVINPANGSADRTISFRRDEYDHPQSPTNCPYAMQFTKTGYGAILLRTDGSDAYRWKVIDCANGDSISIHPTWFTVPEYHDFRDVFISYDKGKIFMTSSQYDNNIAVLDGFTHNIELLLPPVVSYGNILLPNRTNGNIWIAQTYEQFVLHPDLTESAKSQIDLENLHGADFTYRNNEPEALYVSADDQLNIFDYHAGNTIMTTEIQYGLQGVMATTNGEQMFIVRSTDYNSDLLFFASSIFKTKKK